LGLCRQMLRWCMCCCRAAGRCCCGAERGVHQPHGGTGDAFPQQEQVRSAWLLLGTCSCCLLVYVHQGLPALGHVREGRWLAGITKAAMGD
jgi:hypothetical protein